jgi:surface antigen
MTGLTDEMLMAYVDGELDAAARAQVESRLSQSPDREAKLAVFQKTGAPLADLFREPMDEAPPAHLVALVMGTGAALKQHKRTTSAGKSRHFFEAAAEFLFGSSAQWATGLAYGAAMIAVGASAGWYMHSVGSGEMRGPGLVAFEQGQILAEGALARALETTPSGIGITLTSDNSPAATVKADLTFRSRQQGYCRQYELAMPGDGHAGIACRRGDGKWRLEIYAAAAARPSSSTRIIPAGEAGSSTVEAAVSSMMEGDALGSDDEKTLIGNRWRP